MSKQTIDYKTVKPHRIFISGPMSGLPEYNFPNFYRMADRLKNMGFEVVNPADLAITHEVAKVIADPIEFRAMLEEEWEALRHCDTILLLEGWENSKGGRSELELALELGLKIITESSLKLSEFQTAAAWRLA